MANPLIRRWIEGLEDNGGSLGHWERMHWSPSVHKSEFRATHRAVLLLLLAQKTGHSLFGRLPEHFLVSNILPKMTKMNYVKHVSYEPVTLAPYDADKEMWLDSFLDYWYERIEDSEWECSNVAAMGITVCGNPAEDSVCCDDDDCHECSTFKMEAAQKGVYEV
eukprot:2492923-Prymnesium_polylepis.1